MSNLMILKEAPGASSTRRASIPPGAFWTGFGSETLVCASDRATAEAAGAALTPESARQACEESINPEELFLVLQKGRLFQREYPKARVILDKGRFLVVHLPPDQRELVHVSEAPCYSIRSLPRNEAVFEARRRVAARAPLAAVQAFVDRIDIERFRPDVIDLADMHTRHSFSVHYGNAVEMVRTRLADLGFSVRLQDVTVGSRITRNVIADRVGTAANGARFGARWRSSRFYYPQRKCSVEGSRC